MPNFVKKIKNTVFVKEQRHNNFWPEISINGRKDFLKSLDQEMQRKK